MSVPQPSLPSELRARTESRTRTTLAAFFVGLPMAAGILCLIHLGPLRDTVVRRYVRHPLECVEVVMFCAALGALGAKLVRYVTERRACLTTIVPPWDGKAVPASAAAKLLPDLQKLPGYLQSTVMVRRVSAVVDFLCRRGSALELDDQLRALADTDALALEGSYSLTRFITWAIPILGFLGTVLGITAAISGVTPEVLEHSLSTVTDGLALAFDATALALGLTMITMFASFVVERAEQSILDCVDRYADRELAHRFEREGAQESEFFEMTHRNTAILLEAVEKIIERQAALWSEALQESERRRVQAEQQQQERLTTALEAALEKTLETHARRLAALEKQMLEHGGGIVGELAGLANAMQANSREQQASLAQVTQAVAAQVEALASLQEGDKHLRRLQETLNQNLATLAGAGAFEQALHSLTAAIHLLTARANSTTSGASASRPGPQPRAAA
jgi:predicted  nucleic acid-binding Zn-ribbon protein